MEVQIHYELAALTFMLAATLVFFDRDIYGYTEAVCSSG